MAEPIEVVSCKNCGSKMVPVPGKRRIWSCTCGGTPDREHEIKVRVREAQLAVLRVMTVKAEAAVRVAVARERLRREEAELERVEGELRKAVDAADQASLV